MSPILNVILSLIHIYNLPFTMYNVQWGCAWEGSSMQVSAILLIDVYKRQGLSLYCFLSFAYLFIKNVIVVIKPYLSLTLHNQSLIEWHSV